MRDRARLKESKGVREVGRLEGEQETMTQSS